jgi:hypothetical protein
VYVMMLQLKLSRESLCKDELELEILANRCLKQLGMLYCQGRSLKGRGSPAGFETVIRLLRTTHLS